jgi:hypothetical protein
MSIDAASATSRAVAAGAAFEAAAVRHALRIACGVTLAFAVAEALGWRASFLAPVLALQLLAAPGPAPSLAAGVGFVAALALPLAVTLVLGPTLLPFPDLYVLAITAAVFAGFYWHTRSGSLGPFLMLIVVTVVPVLMGASRSAAAEFAGILLQAGIAAILVAWIAHAAFPAPGAARPPTISPAPVEQDPSPRVRSALLDTLVVMPLVLLFLVTNFPTAMVATVSTLVIVRQGSGPRGTRTALGLLLGNLIGGASALVAYQVLIAAPSLPLLTALVLLAGLGFGWRIATAGRSAPVFVIAFTTMLILFGAGLSPFKETGTAFLTRLLYVLFAGGYAIGMLALTELLRARARV